MKKQIGKYNIEFKEKLSWYDVQIIQAKMMEMVDVDIKGGKDIDIKNLDASKMLDSKVVLFSIMILSIQEGERSFPFSIEWLKDLSFEEGDELDNFVGDLYTEFTKKKER